jgi:hypothetical protein
MESDHYLWKQMNYGESRLILLGYPFVLIKAPQITCFNASGHFSGGLWNWRSQLLKTKSAAWVSGSRSIVGGALAS